MFEFAVTSVNRIPEAVETELACACCPDCVSVAVPFACDGKSVRLSLSRSQAGSANNSRMAMPSFPKLKCQRIAIRKGPSRVHARQLNCHRRPRIITFWGRPITMQENPISQKNPYGRPWNYNLPTQNSEELGTASVTVQSDFIF